MIEYVYLTILTFIKSSFQKADAEADAEKNFQEYSLKEKSYKEQVANLEREMRLIIHQSQQMKKDNDAKLSKLAGALGEFTTLLQPK